MDHKIYPQEALKVVRVIDHKIYPRKALIDGRHAYKGFCNVQVTPLKNNLVEVAITPKLEHRDNSREVILEFLNFVLDKAVQLQVEET